MAQNSSAYLIPLIMAFLVFAARFYARENAVSKTSPAFLLALLMVALLVAYMTLSVTASLIPYASLGFGIAGVLVLALAVFMFLS